MTPGSRAEAVADVAHEGEAPRGIGVRAVGEPDVEGQQPVRVVSLGSAEQPLGGAHREAGRRHQHERRRHLEDDERVAPALASTAHGGAAPAVVQHVAQRRGPGAARGNRAEDGGGEDREDAAEGERAPVGAEVLPARQVAQQRGRHVVAHRARAERHQGHGQRGRRHRRHDALGQELAHDPAAAGAEGQAQRQLALPLGAAREDEVRDVDAGDQHHQDGRRLPDGQDVGQHRIAESEVEGSDGDAAAGVGLRVLLLDPARDDGQLRSRLGQRASVGQAAQDGQVVLVAPGLGGRGQRQRDPGLRAVGELEPRRGDADDLVRLHVQGHRAAHHRLAAEAAPPERIAEDDAAVLPFLRLLGEERASGGGGDAERLEEPGGDGRGLDVLRGAVGAKARLPLVDGDHLRDRALRLGLPVEEVGRRHVLAVDAVGAGTRLREADEPRRVGVLERPQDHGVQDVEDDAVGGQPHGQRPDHEEADPGALRHRAQREPYVPDELGHRRTPFRMDSMVERTRRGRSSESSEGSAARRVSSSQRCESGAPARTAAV